MSSTTSPFKAFIPYIAQIPESFDPQFFDGRVDAHDPSGGQWRSVHLTSPLKGEGLVVDLSGAGRLLAVQFNERILPGKVRDEHLARRVKQLEDSQGRKISKKEFAQLRDEIEFDLLPKAFIRRSTVFVAFTKMRVHIETSPSGDIDVFKDKHVMLVCTSSQKRADDTIAVLRAAFGESWIPHPIETDRSAGGFLTALAQYLDPGEYEDGSAFFPLDSAVLKGDEKQTVRIKDKLIEAADVQALLKADGYRVTEMGVGWSADGGTEEYDIEYTLTESLLFKRLVMPDVKAAMVGEDFHGFAVLCIQQYRNALASLIAACGGLKPVVKTETAFASDDEI